MEASKKTFEDIHDAYAFFQQHSTEARECTAALHNQLKRLSPRSGAWSLADFGCGAGEFTDGLLSLCQFAPHELSLSIIEPDEKYREAATQRLARFSSRPITSFTDLGAQKHSGPSADTLLCNHVLYYVPDLTATLSDLLAIARPGGKMLITMANRQNALLQGWDFLFGLLGEKCPFHVAEDLASILSTQGLSHFKLTVPSTLQFEDTESNRVLILRFLLGEHIRRHSTLEPALVWFDRFQKGSLISMPLCDDLFTVSVPR